MVDHYSVTMFGEVVLGLEKTMNNNLLVLLCGPTIARSDYLGGRPSSSRGSY